MRLHGERLCAILLPISWWPHFAAHVQIGVAAVQCGRELAARGGPGRLRAVHAPRARRISSASHVFCRPIRAACIASAIIWWQLANFSPSLREEGPSWAPHPVERPRGAYGGHLQEREGRGARVHDARERGQVHRPYDCDGIELTPFSLTTIFASSHFKVQF